MADEQEMVFQGFILLENKLKEGTRDSIQRLEKMGLEVKIITGYNRLAALHIAKALGMSGESMGFS